MMNQIVNRLSPTAPTEQDHRLIKSFPSFAVALLKSVQPDGRLHKEVSISAEMRQQMISAADRLSSIMTDKRPDVELMTIGFLLSSFPRQAGPSAATEMVIKAYEMAIEEVPTWAVEEAARKWITGKCGDKRFAPSPPELRCTADEVVMVTRGKITSLRQLAKAEIASDPTPEQLERARRLPSEFARAFAHVCVGDKPRKMDSAA